MKLRFKKADGTPYEDWGTSSLGEVSEVLSSKRIFQHEYTPTGIPFYRGKEISELKKNKDIKELLYISNQRYEEIKNQFPIPQKGDILITAVGTIGNVYRIPNDDPFYFKDGNIIWLKDITQKTQYIALILEAMKKEILAVSSGSSQSALTIEKVKEFQIPLPCLEEQQKIADFFTALDEKITLIDAQLSQLNLYKKAQLQTIFSPENKENWGAMRLSDIVTIKISSVDKHVKDDEITVPVCDYMNVYNNNFITTNISQTFRIGTVTESEYDRFRLRKGDVVITKDSETPDDIGIPAYVAEDIKDLVCGYHLTILSPKELVCGKYLFFTLITKYAQTQFACYANGSTRFGLTKETYDKIMIPLPSLEEQAKIADYLSALDDKITNTQQSLEQIKSYKLAMLQKMLGGIGV